MVFFWNKTVAQDFHQITLVLDTKDQAPEKTIKWKAGENTEVLQRTSADSFTIFVRVGDQIEWKAVSLTEADIPVTIEELKYTGGPRIFASDVLRGGKSINGTVIRGGRELYFYQIRFRIGSGPEIYQVSSRIQVGE